MLEREGLVTSLPNRGTFVTRVTVEDSLAICDVREELEGLAVRLAVRNFTAEDRERLVTEILTGDPGRAEAAVQEHIREAAARLQRMYTEHEHAS
jgi:DNA-binding GntR family transcriptional regulator